MRRASTCRIDRVNAFSPRTRSKKTRPRGRSTSVERADSCVLRIKNGHVESVPQGFWAVLHPDQPRCYSKLFCPCSLEISRHDETGPHQFASGNRRIGTLGGRNDSVVQTTTPAPPRHHYPARRAEHARLVRLVPMGDP